MTESNGKVTFYVLLSFTLVFVLLLAVYAQQWKKGILDTPVFGTYYPFFMALSVGVFVSFGISSWRFYKDNRKTKEASTDKPKPTFGKIKEAGGMPTKCPEFYRSVVDANGKKTCVADVAFVRNVSGDKTCTLKRNDTGKPTVDDDVFDIGDFGLDANNMSTNTVCEIRSIIPWSSASVMDSTCRSGGTGQWQCINKDTRELLQTPNVSSSTLTNATSQCKTLAAKLVTPGAAEKYVAQLV